MAADKVKVNYGYFKTPAGHMWTYGVDAHTWTDPTTGDEFEFEYWPQTSGAKVIEKLQTGDIQMAHLGSAPWATGATRSTPATMIYNIHSKDLSQSLVVRTDIQRPMELKGKRLAYIRGSTTHYMLEVLLGETGLKNEDFEWIGHMDAATQRAAWDAGAIDAGYMWGSNMRHLQSNPWCGSPASSGSWDKYIAHLPNRSCATEPKGQNGLDLFTAGISKRWGREVWNNLAVSNEFETRYPRAVARVIKIISAMDTKVVTDSGFFTNFDNRLCPIAVASDLGCDAGGLQTAATALGWDEFQTWEVQRSPAYLGEQVAGQCALEAIPATGAATCTADTASGSAILSRASAEFGFRLKQYAYLPPLKHYQNLMNTKYIDLVATSDDYFPSITAASLAADYPAATASVSDPSTNHCQDLTQPIVLSTAGTFRDHDNGGFYKDGGSCTWHIDQTAPVLLSSIDVKIETKRDTVHVYGGLCTLTDGDCDTPAAPLLAVFSAGKGQITSASGASTISDINPRPPVLAASGKVTIVFQTDGTVDRPLPRVVDDGISMSWAVASAGTCPLPCQNGGNCVDGECQCTDGWGGADCSFAACLGTSQLTADATVRKVVHGPSVGSPHGSDCRWVITADTSDKVVLVEFVKLDLEWPEDPLMFYDGEGVAATGMLVSYSGFSPPSLGYAVGNVCPGPSCPGMLISNGSKLTVRWTSDYLQGGLGFELKFTSAAKASVLCGAGATANCSGHGSCQSSSGCFCADDYFGQFCQFSQCAKGVRQVGGAVGTLRNMGRNDTAYEPLRDCSWSIAPPAQDSQERHLGAVALFFKKFDLEATEQSSDRVEVDGLSFSGLSPPCVVASTCSDDGGCHGGSCKDGACECSPIVVSSVTAQLDFVTDVSDLPEGSSHAGFEIEYHAIYDCPTDVATGLCAQSAACAKLDQVPATSSSMGDKLCQACPAGNVFLFATQSCVCEPGRFTDVISGVVTCTKCPPGSFADQPGTVGSCSPCAAGTVSGSDGATSCDRCPTGEFQNVTGGKECHRCDEPFTTIFQAATSETDCLCPEGMYKHEGVCKSCPAGMVCPIGSDFVNLATATPSDGQEGSKQSPYPYTPSGFWSSKVEPLSVFGCRSELNCPGGAPGSCGTNFVKQACDKCADGWRFDGKKCVSCNGAESSKVLLILVPFIVLPMIFIALYRFFGDGIEKWESWQNTSSAVMFIALNHYQAASLASSANIRMPVFMSDTMEASAWTNDMASVLSPGCAGFGGFESMMVTKAIGPIVLVLIAIIVFFLSRPVSKVLAREELRMEPNRCFNTIASLMFTFFNAIVAAALVLFKCSPNPNGKDTLAVDFTIICWDGSTWQSMLVLGIFCVLLYVIGIGGLFARTIYIAPRGVNFSQKDFQMRWKFLFIKFSPTAHWWCLAILAKNLFLNMGLVMFVDGIEQLYWLMMVLVFYICTIVVIMPFRYRLANFVELASGMSIVFLCTALMWLAEHDEKFDRPIAMSASVLVWVPLMISLAFVGYLVYTRRATTVLESTLVKDHAFVLQQFKHFATLAEHGSGNDTNTFWRTIGDFDRYYLKKSAECIGAELTGKANGIRLVNTNSGIADLHKEASSRSTNSKSNDKTIVVI